MFKKLLLACLMVAALAVLARAQGQQGGGGGGGQNPPAPAPQPAPAPGGTPSQPRPTAPPTQPDSRSGFEIQVIRGKIITDTGRPADSMIEVRFETDDGQRIGNTFTNLGGEFQYKPYSSQVRDLYAVVEVKGFRRYRERMNGPFGAASFGGEITIFLERENAVVRTGTGGSPIVDVRQLRVKIPGKAVDEYEKALKDSSKGNTTRVLERLQRAIQLAPDFYEAQNKLGVEYLKLQKYSESEAALTLAKDLNPSAADPLVNLGTLYYQRAEIEGDAGHAEQAAGMFQKAAGFYQESIKRNPLSAFAMSSLGAALFKTAAYAEAESMIHRALELDNELHDARLTLINIYSRQNRLKEALEQTNIFLANSPGSPHRPAVERIRQRIETTLKN